MDGISRSRGWDKEIRHGVLEQLVLSDKWARTLFPISDICMFTQCVMTLTNLLTTMHIL